MGNVAFSGCHRAFYAMKTYECDDDSSIIIQEL